MSKQKVNNFYTCYGPIRGYCDVKHRHLGSAVRHTQKDQNDCTKVGGYSDRNIVRWDNEPLSKHEELDIEYIKNMDYPK